MRLAPLEGGEEAERTPLWRRLCWMAAIWLASVTALGVAAFVLRLWLA
ncbi:MAG: DUF2474 domain-containing protein [Erythrobacter sp.]|jgi:hypothetical protein